MPLEQPADRGPLPAGPIEHIVQREDPRPVQLAHAIRSLTEDYGLTMKQVAGRLKRAESWCSNLLNLVMLPTAIQESVASGV